MCKIEFNLFGVWVNYTVCILRYSRRFEGKIFDLLDLESGGPSPYCNKWEVPTIIFFVIVH